MYISTAFISHTIVSGTQGCARQTKRSNLMVVVVGFTLLFVVCAFVPAAVAFVLKIMDEQKLAESRRRLEVKRKESEEQIAEGRRRSEEEFADSERRYELEKKEAAQKAPELIADLVERIQLQFLVQPCFRCHEFKMVLLDVSPNGRSIKYQCVHCNKKMHAAAGTPESSHILEVWNAKMQLPRACRHEIDYRVFFDAPAAPLPYEQTSRTPIPEAVRSEVWRRDGGRCVKCGSNANLEFDHIIPVALGGANSIANLQLLCQPCNSSKGKKI